MENSEIRLSGQWRSERIFFRAKQEKNSGCGENQVPYGTIEAKGRRSCNSENIDEKFLRELSRELDILWTHLAVHFPRSDYFKLIPQRFLSLFFCLWFKKVPVTRVLIFLIQIQTFKSTRSHTVQNNMLD